MEGIIETVKGYLQSINWQGPAAFAATAIVILAIMKQWKLIVLVFVVLIIGLNIENYWVIDLELNGVPITTPVIVYLAGAVIIALVAFTSSL